MSASRLQSACDIEQCFQHAIEVFEHFGVVRAADVIAVRFDIPRAGFVIGDFGNGSNASVPASREG